MAARIAVMVASRRAIKCICPTHLLQTKSAATRFFGTTTTTFSSADATAIEMVNYARHHSRSPNATSYQDSLRVLEHGLSIYQGADTTTSNAAGRLLLAMATLNTDRGDIRVAIEKLSQVSEMTFASLEVRVAALESLTGLNLRMHQDAAASQYGDKCFHLLESADIKMDEEALQALRLRAKAIKGLAELAHGRFDSAESHFAGFNADDIKKNKNGLGAVALSYAEFAHVSGNFSLAKQLYELALEISGTDVQVPAAAPMVSEDIQLGATCGLGQLATRAGKFDEAEQRLTEVLRKAEEYCGGHNYRVGIALSCIADMFGRKGQSEGASYFFIQEGLYRRALEMLKAPPLDHKVSPNDINLRDVVALTRGGYAQLLSRQHNRVGEAQMMREWADAVWSNNRTSMTKVLENTKTLTDNESKTDITLVTDIRLGRVF